MISGRWLSEEDVNQTLWWHWLDVIVPNENDSSNALLFVGSGSSKDKKIFLDSLAISQSLKTESIVAYISTTIFRRVIIIAAFIISISATQYRSQCPDASRVKHWRVVPRRGKEVVV